jgi:hypothetical protein
LGNVKKQVGRHLIPPYWPAAPVGSDSQLALKDNGGWPIVRWQRENSQEPTLIKMNKG